MLNLLSLSPKPVIMGIINVTPDSFSDGGEFMEPSRAAARALAMAEQGANILDVGGESTRPGAEPVTPDEQIKRVVPVIRELARQNSPPISIDTTSSKVAQAALDAGASIINDISALRCDPKMAELAADRAVPTILMHMQGQPRSMQTNPTYTHVVKDVKQFLAERIDFAVSRGIDRSRIVIDPGIGFGKTVRHNLQLLLHLDELIELGTAVLVGVSRKSFIGKLLDLDDPAKRIFGTASALAWCVAAGVHILRVHDVKEMAEVIRIATAIRNADL